MFSVDVVYALEYPHQGDGTRAKLLRHRCSAARTIYVPEDPAVRMACVVPNHEKAHTHPILPATKTSTIIRETYKDCVRTAGVVGSSVRTVDNGKSLPIYTDFYAFQFNLLTISPIAQSTHVLLGTTPSLYAPTLQNNRVKQDIIRKVKKESYPYGTDIPGTYQPHCCLI